MSPRTGASPSKSPRPAQITEALLRRWRLPALDRELGKVSRGTVLVVGGSREVPGAVMLAAIGALRAGAGRLQIATARSVATGIAVATPEARVIGLRETSRGELATGAHRPLRAEIARCDALLLGPGVRDAAPLCELFDAYLLEQERAPVLLDAGALEVLARAKHRRARSADTARIIATPHAGEMAKMCGIDKDEVLARPQEVVREAAQKFGIIIALKGAHTYVASPDGQLFCNTAGNLGLGTSGSGDTLSGVIAGLCARGAEPLQATAWGVYLHARAGEALARKLGPLGFLARELLGEIPPLLGALSRRR